jgi:hypothetical protein
MASIATPADATDAGISITVGQPDFYGRLDIDDYPRPQRLYSRPILVERVPHRTPVYMHVPPGHAKHWSKHCREYDACGEREYFLQDSWYSNEYIPRYPVDPTTEVCAPSHTLFLHGVQPWHT